MATWLYLTSQNGDHVPINLDLIVTYRKLETMTDTGLVKGTTLYGDLRPDSNATIWVCETPEQIDRMRLTPEMDRVAH